jgi:DNA-binding transcriptional MerR regulator
MQFVPEKLYYKIGEVCEILGVEAHVLRYWETEFSNLSPPKSRSGQRTYRPKDIELLLEIRRLLYEEGFTIAGARKRLGIRAGRKPEGQESAKAKPAAARTPQQLPAPVPKRHKSRRLKEVREELENILTLLRRE